MLNKSQFKYLLSLVDEDIERIIGGERLGMTQLVVNYNEFKERMELDDIRFHWLTGDNVYIAGGAVLSWVVSGGFNNDTDFFFTNPTSAELLENLIDGYGFVKSNDTYSTRTYQYKEDGSVIQLVGINDKPYWGNHDSLIGGTLFGRPFDNILKFDFTVSQFAVDCENVYTFNQSVVDVMARKLYLVDDYTNEARLKKYVQKGFHRVNGQTYIRPSRPSYTRSRY